jgi:cytosine/adenosine deaminase-related metal-dependent hydrolase
MLYDMTSTLIRGGRLLTPEPRTGDLLVTDDAIEAVGPDIRAADAEVIDATDCLVLPGFVDTHRHVWQAPLQSLLPDTLLRPYLQALQERIMPRYRPADMRVASLVGALQCLDSGITSVVDYANLQPTPEHTDAAIDGLLGSGIRGVYGYGSTTAVGHVVDRLAGTLIRPAIAALGPEHGDPEPVERDWGVAAEYGLSVMVHVGGYGTESATTGLKVLRERDLLRPGTLYVHANSYSDEQLRLIADSGGAISASPIVEAAMDHGAAITGRSYALGIPTGLGADAVTSGPADMFSLMRYTYAAERLSDKGFTGSDVLRLATVDGARAAGLNNVGTLEPGAPADIVLLRTDRLGIVPAHDPVATVIQSGAASAVDTVLVAGRIVKKDGRLVGHDVPALIKELTASAEFILQRVPFR